MMPISIPAAFAHAPRQLSAMMGRFLRFDEVESLWMETTRSESSGPGRQAGRAPRAWPDRH